MQLEVKKLERIPLFDVNKIKNARKNKLTPHHMNINKKETLKVASFSKALYSTKLELKTR